MPTQAETRLRGFKIHLAIYVAVTLLAVAANFIFDSETPWFLAVMVGWGAPLAVHCAYAMGFFGERKP